MEISYTVMVYIFAYIVGAINKLFFDEVPNKYIPLQNVIIGILSGIFYYFVTGENLVQALILCFMAAVGAGGTADLKKLRKGDE